MDARLKYLIVTLSDRHADQRTSTASSDNTRVEYKHSETLLEGANRVRKHVLKHSCNARAHAFRFWEPTGVYDRQIVFESLVGEYETSCVEALEMRRSSGADSAGTPDSFAHLWSTS